MDSVRQYMWSAWPDLAQVSPKPPMVTRLSTNVLFSLSESRGRGNHWSWLGWISYRDASAKEQWLDHVSRTVTPVNEWRTRHGRLYAVHPRASVANASSSEWHAGYLVGRAFRWWGNDK